MMMPRNDLNDDQPVPVKLLLVETVYNLADAIADSVDTESSEAREKREAAISRLEELLKAAQSAQNTEWPFDPANAWILDVLGDLAEFARASGYERTYAKLVACHAWITLSISN